MAWKIVDRSFYDPALYDFADMIKCFSYIDF